MGRALEARGESWFEALTYGGELIVTAGSAWRSLQRLRMASVVRHAYETGYQAVPVVAVIAFLISVISAYIGAQQLRPYGAEIFTVDLVALGVLRELGVLLTAIMVAGRTGSAYAAEIGVMKLNDEVDALESMGVNPYEVLVLPRVLGLVIALPLLTIVADFMGLLGGALLARYLIDLPWPQFFTRLDEAIAPTTFWAGLVKAPVFGLLIALTGTFRGLQVRESSRELGPTDDRRGRAVDLPRDLRRRAVRDLLPRDRLLMAAATPASSSRCATSSTASASRPCTMASSFDVHAGEVFGIVGGSGSGKSVLLKTMLGLRRPDAGAVEIEGRDITRCRTANCAT